MKEQVMNSELESIKRKFKLVRDNSFHTIREISIRVMTNDKYRKFNNFMAKNPAAKMLFNMTKTRGIAMTFMGVLVVAGLAEPNTMAYAATIDDTLSYASNVSNAVNASVTETVAEPVETNEPLKTSEETVDLETPETIIVEETSVVSEETPSVVEVTTEENPVELASELGEEANSETILEETETDTIVVDGVEIPVDDASEVVVEETVAEEPALENTTTEEEDIVINVSDFEGEKGFSVAQGQEVEIVFDPVTTGDQTTLVVFEGPDGQKYVAMAPTAGLSHDTKMEAFTDLYDNKKIPYDPYDSATWPEEWVAAGTTPTVEWLTGVLDEGSHFDTILGGFDAKYDANGKLHFWNDGTQEFNVVNTEEGATKGERPDSDTLTELNKGQELTPEEPEKDPEPVVPEEPEKDPEPIVPEEPEKDPEPVVPEEPEKDPEPVVSEVPKTGVFGLGAALGGISLASGAAAAISKIASNRANDIDGYEFADDGSMIIDSPYTNFTNNAVVRVKRR